MTLKIQTVQVENISSAYVGISNLTVSGASLNIATALGTALNTAGRGSVSVPVQVSSNESTAGLICSAPNNRIEIRDNATQNKITSGSEEVYGRLTNSGSVYTLSFFTNNGTESAYTFPSSQAIDIDVPYRFDWHRLPADAYIGISARNVNNDPTQSGGSDFVELLTIATLNTVPNLTKTPSASTAVQLVINGVVYRPIDNNPNFSVSGKAVTWNAAASGSFPLLTTYNVVAIYPSNE